MPVKNEKKKNPFPYPVVLNPIETMAKTVSRKWQILISMKNCQMIRYVALLDLDQFFTDMEPLACNSTSFLEEEMGEESPDSNESCDSLIDQLWNISNPQDFNGRVSPSIYFIEEPLMI